MYRKIIKQLIEWKNSFNHKPLIIKGARQVGKTYIIKSFIEENYPNYIEINLELNKTARKIFEDTIDPIDIINSLKLLYPGKIEEKKTLIFLDEIQICPKAITSLKYFYELGNNYHIITSGSLLGIQTADVSSFPVGKVEMLELLPMDFEEFLYAFGINESQIKDLKKYYEEGSKIPDIMHNIYSDYFKKYIVCGGMPEVVYTYVETNDLEKVIKVQKNIINSYYFDIAKYADKFDKVKVHECFESIPYQLAKENKKFMYKEVKIGGNSRMFEGSLRWLIDAGIIRKCFNIKTPEKPLKTYSIENQFKIYIFDTGLLLAMYEDDIKLEILSGELGTFKGAIYENIVAQILVSKGFGLYYYKKKTGMEIDFIIEQKGSLIPIEVKSSKNNKAKSLSNYVLEYSPDKVYKFSYKNINTEGIIKKYPLYCLMFI